MGSCWGARAELQEQGEQSWKEVGHGAVLGDSSGSPGAQVSARVSLGCQLCALFQGLRCVRWATVHYLKCFEYPGEQPMEITTAGSKHFAAQYVEVLPSVKSDNRITGTLHMNCKIAANKRLAQAVWY